VKQKAEQRERRNEKGEDKGESRQWTCRANAYIRLQKKKKWNEI